MHTVEAIPNGFSKNGQVRKRRRYADNIAIRKMNKTIKILQNLPVLPACNKSCGRKCTTKIVESRRLVKKINTLADELEGKTFRYNCSIKTVKRTVGM